MRGADDKLKSGKEKEEKTMWGIVALTTCIVPAIIYVIIRNKNIKVTGKTSVTYFDRSFVLSCLIIIMCSSLFILVNSADFTAFGLNTTHSYFTTGTSLKNVFNAGIWESNDEPIEFGSAWAGNVNFGGGIAKYFTYNKNAGSQQNPVSIKLEAGADRVHVGYVKVWNNQNTLYVNVETINPYLMNVAHIYPGTVQPQNHSPGNLGYSNETSTPVTGYAFQISRIYTTWDNNPDRRDSTPFASLKNNQTVYIAVHADILIPAGLKISETGLQQIQTDLIIEQTEVKTDNQEVIENESNPEDIDENGIYEDEIIDSDQVDKSEQTESLNEDCEQDTEDINHEMSDINRIEPEGFENPPECE